MPLTYLLNISEFKIRALVVLYKCFLICLLLPNYSSQSVMCGPLKGSGRSNCFPDNTETLFTLFPLFVSICAGGTKRGDVTITLAWIQAAVPNYQSLCSLTSIHSQWKQVNNTNLTILDEAVKIMNFVNS